MDNDIACRCGYVFPNSTNTCPRCKEVITLECGMCGYVKPMALPQALVCTERYVTYAAQNCRVANI